MKVVKSALEKAAVASLRVPRLEGEDNVNHETLAKLVADYYSGEYETILFALGFYIHDLQKLPAFVKLLGFALLLTVISYCLGSSDEYKHTVGTSAVGTQPKHQAAPTQSWASQQEREAFFAAARRQRAEKQQAEMSKQYETNPPADHTDGKPKAQ